MLTILNDGAQAEQPGRELGELNERQISACVDLHELGLVSFTPGWRLTWWFRLTQAGQAACNKQKQGGV